MKRPEGFDERPDRPVEPSDAPASERPAGRFGGFGRALRRDGGDGLEARRASSTSAPVDGSDTPDDGLAALGWASETGPVDGTVTAAGDLPDLPDLDDDDLPEASADRAATPATTGLRRGRAGEFAGAAGRRVGAGLTSGFASVAERLREYGADDDHRADRARGEHPHGDADDQDLRRDADDQDLRRDAEDRRAEDAADSPDGDEGGAHDARVTDVLDWTRASRPDESGTADPHTDAADRTHDVPIGARVLAAETAREARVARRRRRLLERAEVRRFTRRSRHRRAAWTTAAALVLVLGVSILVAVFSPLMALRTIEVHGADRVDEAAVRQALSDQMGRPLARLDFTEIKRDLATFPLIESYVTEEAPPHTLVVTITERTPIVAVESSAGYDLVDPAGIVVQERKDPPEGLPVADVSATKVGSSVFRTMTEVVLALPSTVRTQVTGITASTEDDVTLTMQDGSRVVWGSPDESPRKAALLAALVADHTARTPGTPVEYDVSAPENGIVRSQG